MVGVRSSIYRNAKYKNAINQEDYQPVKIKGYLPDMYNQFVQSSAVSVNVGVGVKMILAEAAVPTIQNPWYIAFGNQVQKLTGLFGGGQLLKEIDIILEKWVSRGLDRDNLEKIRNTIFSYAAPAP